MRQCAGVFCLYNVFITKMFSEAILDLVKLIIKKCTKKNCLASWCSKLDEFDSELDSEKLSFSFLLSKAAIFGCLSIRAMGEVPCYSMSFPRPWEVRVLRDLPHPREDSLCIADNINK